MPIVQNKYVCPAWTNGASPAINASELLAIGETLEELSGAYEDGIAIANGGTGATNASDARTALGITPANIGALTQAVADGRYLKKTDASSLIATTTESASPSNIPANTSHTFTINFTKSGYKPVAIAGFSLSGSNIAGCLILRNNISSSAVGSGTATVIVRNTLNATTATSVQPNLQILWAKQ